MGNPVPTLKIIVILLIAINLVWFSDRLFSLVGLDIYGMLPLEVMQLISLCNSALIILFNVLLLALLPRLQLKPE